MPISERVQRLREQSLTAVESITTERAELLTEFYQRDRSLESIPVQRARAFAYLLEHKVMHGQLTRNRSSLTGRVNQCATVSFKR